MTLSSLPAHSLFSDSTNLENDWVLSVWTGVADCVFVPSPREARVVPHRVNLRKQNHQSAVADVALKGPVVEQDFVAHLTPKDAFPPLTFHGNSTKDMQILNVLMFC